MELIIIAVLFFIFKMAKKTYDEASAANNKNVSSQMTRQSVGQNVQRWKTTIENVEKNEHFQQANMHKNQENRDAMRQIQASRMEAKNTTILQRAQANVAEDIADVTLQTMEAEHNHSERVAPAKHYHPEDAISESALGTIEDLMVKGYEGNLCFERDFLGEAMDMISRFTVPSDVPDFSKEDGANAV